MNCTSKLFGFMSKVYLFSLSEIEGREWINQKGLGGFFAATPGLFSLSTLRIPSVSLMEMFCNYAKYKRNGQTLKLHSDVFTINNKINYGNYLLSNKGKIS